MDILIAALLGIVAAQLADLYWPRNSSNVSASMTEDPMTVEIWEQRLLSVYG